LLHLVVVLVAVVGLSTASANGAAYYPLLVVNGDAHLLGEVNDLVFNLEYLSAAGQAHSAAIQTPAGFSGSFVHAPGTKIGTAGLGALPAGTNISTSHASITRYTGSLMVGDPTALANDPTVQACSQGAHKAIWQLTLANVANGNLTLPVTVDASKGGYKLTVCFDALQQAGKEVEYLWFAPDEIFRNPGRHGNYLFDAVVTQLGAEGSPNADSAYELRGYQELPQILTVDSTYDQSTKLLTATGKLAADGKPRKALSLEFYAAATQDAVNWKDLGTTVTGNDGAFTFTKKLASLNYHYVYVVADDLNAPTCPGNSAQPAGCASTSIDGRSSIPVEIATRR
jgi:hypothetical protein